MVYPFLLILALALFAALAWHSRPLAVALVAAALPCYLLRFDLFGLPTTLLEWLTIVLIVSWIARGEWKRVRDLPRPWLYAAGFMLLAAVVATITSADRHAALGILKAYFVEPILFFLVAATTLTQPRDRLRTVFAFGAGAAFASLVAVFQRATGLAIPVPWDVSRRATGPFPYPNALALYVEPAVVLAAFRLYELACAQTKNARAIAAWAAIAALGAAGVVLAQSEAGGAALLATLFAASLFVPRLRRFTVPLAGAALAIFFAIPAGRRYLIQKIQFGDYSEQVRLGQWQETWNMLRTRPIFGAGLSGYPAALKPFHTHTADEIFQYPHTLVFNVWSELGLLGLAALAFLAWAAVRAVRDGRERPERWFVFACLAVFAEMTLHGLADVPYFKNDLSVLTWIFLALLVAAAYGRTSARNAI